MIVCLLTIETKGGRIMEKDTFGTRLAKLRENRPRRQIALQLNISPQAMFFWEKDEAEPSFENLRKICKLFGVSSDYLLGLSDEDSKVITNSNIVNESPNATATIQQNNDCSNCAKLNQLTAVITSLTQSNAELTSIITQKM